MISAGGRYVITYNGEVYNFAELRRELEPKGHIFRGHSDTEVMLAAFEQWGIESAAKRFVGMFAFGVWDRASQTLYLVRDRLGIKPLYYGWAGQTFLFSSELKAFRAYSDFKAEINRDALALYLRHNYVPTPFSIYRNVYKLLPGCIFVVPRDQVCRASAFSPFPEDQQARWKPVRYWSLREVAERGCAHPFEGSDVEAVEHLDCLLRDAVRLRMVADVPLGAFLSGGIDSSTVVALMQAQSKQPVKTFTIGFHEQSYNEAHDAQEVARCLGTEHTELYVTPEEAMAVIPKLSTLYDEPFSDSSQIPTFLVSDLARRYATVSLSGDGGDELFAGYNRYFWWRSIGEKIGWMSRGVRSAVASAATAVSPQGWNCAFDALGPLLPFKLRSHTPGDKLHKMAAMIVLDSPEAMYYGLVSHWNDPTSVVLDSCEPPTTLTNPSLWADLPDFTQQMMYLDTVTYLPDDILTKLDRASMGVSLEARVPLLDHRVVEFAWQVPVSMKVRHGRGKWLLQQVLCKYVPRKLIERPKMGFGMPIDVWLRGPLRGWAESLLDERRLREDGFFNPEPIQKKWVEHLSGRYNRQDHLWDILMFQAWKERWC